MDENWTQLAEDALLPLFGMLNDLDGVDRVISANVISEALRTQTAQLAQVRRAAIRQLTAEGWTQKELARETGLSQQRIAQILAGDTPRNRKERK